MGILDFFGKFGKDPLTPKQAAAKQKLLSELDRLGQEVKLRKTLVEAAIREEKPGTLGQLYAHGRIVYWARELFRGDNLKNAVNLIGYFLMDFARIDSDDKGCGAMSKMNMQRIIEDSGKALSALKKLVEST